jgi:hypothetical protein
MQVGCIEGRFLLTETQISPHIRWAVKKFLGFPYSLHSLTSMVWCTLSSYRLDTVLLVISTWVLVWAGSVGISCTTDSARKLCCIYFCSRNFSDDFTTAERVHLNRVAVPYASDSAAQSFPQPPYLVKMNIRFSIIIVFL